MSPRQYGYAQLRLLVPRPPTIWPCASLPNGTVCCIDVGAFGVAQEGDHMCGELRGIIGECAEIAVFHCQSLRTHNSGDHRNPGGERLQQLHPHTGPA